MANHWIPVVGNGPSDISLSIALAQQHKPLGLLFLGQSKGDFGYSCYFFLACFME